MDLIDRAAVLDKFNDKNTDVWRSLTDEEASKRFWLFCKVADALDEIPTIPAVPLDKLCEWLGKCANPCKIGIRCHYPEDCMPTVECWRYVLTKWMEEQEITT